MQKIFVTGATGLLGSEMVEQLLAEKSVESIVCLVRDHVPQSRLFEFLQNPKIKVVHGNICDEALMRRILNEYRIDTVFHLAAQTLVEDGFLNPTETLDVNIRGTWCVLEAIRCQLKYFKLLVVASSDKAYGNLGSESYDETHALRGEHPYDVSKSCADLITQTYAKTYGLNAVITRCGNLFGPGDLNESRLIPTVIRAALQHERPVLRSDGMQIRDYLFVGDAARAYLELAKLASDGQFKGEAFNFSYGLKLTALEVTKRVLAQMKTNLEPIILNQAKNEIPIQTLSSEKAKRILNWQPKHGFDEGIKKTVEWYSRMKAKS